MTDTHETIADVIAAKRRLAAEMEKALGDQHTSVEMLKDDADRIEAAHKREIEATAAKCCQLGRLAGYGASEIKHQQEPVGNAAKLREAIITIRDKAYEQYVNDYGIDTVWIQDVANAALAAPPRNCDRFATVKEATEAFARERQDMPHPCPDFTFSRWLLTPVKKEGGAK